jgi:hypothetical protein
LAALHLIEDRLGPGELSTSGGRLLLGDDDVGRGENVEVRKEVRDKRLGREKLRLCALLEDKRPKGGFEVLERLGGRAIGERSPKTSRL